MDYKNFPFVIGWELTLRCNLQCKHCASSAGYPRDNELTLDESLSICEQLPDLLVNEVIFTGGEPLLYKNWHTIALALHNCGIKTGMVTNGLLIDDKIIENMKKSGMNCIGISIDGIGELHDRLRCFPGAFEKIIKNIENLRRNNINITVITSITHENILKLDDIYHLITQLGAWKWQLQPIFPLGRGNGNSHLHLTEEQFVSLGKYIFHLQPVALKKGLEIVPADSCGYFSSLDIPEFNWQGCGAGRFSCGIMSNGYIKGCLSWPDTIIEGDLRKDDLWTIWFRPDSFSKQRFFSKEDMNGNCIDCEVAMECGGGCQAMSLAKTGMWRADPYCYRRILKEKGTLLKNPH
ncbi:MAG: radical SAM protein [Spirochaetales bacterium]|nr:radical SAM protein [Spirochaetales bacterium]